MSYFTCKHGENYFPFGRGGKEKLLQGLGVISHNPETDESREVLKRIPYFALPFTDVKSSSDYSNEPSSDENTVDKPISLRKPDSDASGIYKNICASMIQSLFTFTTSQLQVT